MTSHNSCGCGKFLTGMGLGLMVGAGFGMTMSPSRRQVRRVAHKATQESERGCGRFSGCHGAVSPDKKQPDAVRLLFYMESGIL